VQGVGVLGSILPRSSDENEYEYEHEHEQSVRRLEASSRQAATPAASKRPKAED